MQLRHALTGCLLALCCVGEVLGQDALRRRQDNTDLTTTAQSTVSASPTSTSPDSSSADSKDEATTTSHLSTVTTSQDSFKTIPSSAKAPPTPTTGLHTSAVAAQATPGASLTNTETLPSVLPGALPLEPAITPAVGIAGVVLIAAGIALCLVGIKHEWLYIFLSTALLGSLAVTVLVLYVMNPPVSDAVQGAFLVGAVITGAMFGAVSLLFKEVTDNLGCLLGGFCFAMWLLVLAPGGIIESTAGRGILIGLLSVGAFASSFSHYTRTYSLIVCTSFAGATATVVGVDCFSRAGLKEFWIYLWDLNSNEFPLATDTYPITRGIKVEIASMIILFVFGLMSQFKIWKIIKQRRSKKEEERLRQKQAREQEEIAVGRDIEAANQRDLAAWEAIYGDKDATQVKTDSGIGSSRRTSQQGESLKHTSTEGFELVERACSQNGHADEKDKSRSSVTVRVASSDWNGAASSRDDLLRSASNSRPPSRQSTTKSSYPVSEVSVPVHSPREEGQTFASGAPTVPPLPFKVPAEKDVSADGSVVSGAPNTHQPNTQRAGALDNPSLSRFLELHSQQDDKRASSVAAIADDDDNMLALSRAASPFDAESNQLLETPAIARSRSESPAKEVDDEEVVEEDDEEVLSRPVTASASNMPKLHSRHGSAASLRSSHQPSLHSRRKNGSVSETIVEQLPPQLSRIAQTYRTNEWAKHIADADVPQAEEVDGHSPGIQVDTAFAQEAAKRVDVEDLQRNSMAPLQGSSVRHDSPALPSPLRESESQALLSRASSTQSTAQRQSLNNGTFVPSFSRQSSSASTSRLAVATTSTRNTPTPLASQPLVESPVEDTLAASGPYRRLSSYRSTITLMDKRHHQLKQRPTTTSFNAPPSAISPNPQLNITTPSNASTTQHKRHNSDTTSLHSIAKALSAEDEDMTLAQRRDLVRQHRRLSNPQQPPKHLPNSHYPPLPTLPVRSSTYGANPTAETLAFDSHQPQRGSVAPSALTQSKRLTEWRQSLQPQKSTPNLSASSPRVESEARMQMLAQQRQVEWVEQKKRGEKEKRESAMESAMRSGVLHGAHRDALRRMQAKARDSAGQ